MQSGFNVVEWLGLRIRHLCKNRIRTGEKDEYVEIRKMKNNILESMRYRTLISGIGYPNQSSKKGIDVYANKKRTKEFMNYSHGLKNTHT